MQMHHNVFLRLDVSYLVSNPLLPSNMDAFWVCDFCEVCILGD